MHKRFILKNFFLVISNMNKCKNKHIKDCCQNIYLLLFFK